MTWAQLQEILTRMAAKLRTDSRGESIPRLPPPIAPETLEESADWLIAWLADQSIPRPGGAVQAAAFARVYCGATMAANAASLGTLPVPEGSVEELLELLLFVMWPSQSSIWDAHWELAYRA